MSASDRRRRLAEQQARLAAALMKPGTELPNFDRDRLAAAAQSLANKRLQSAARAWPDLANSLGEQFAGLFQEYAANHLLPQDGGPLADGRAFADYLARQQKLPDDARLEVLGVDLRFVRTARGLMPRRGFALKMALQKQSPRLVIALRLPWLGERWFRL
jgi:hypothetical protein